VIVFVGYDCDRTSTMMDKLQLNEIDDMMTLVGSILLSNPNLHLIRKTGKGPPALVINLHLSMLCHETLES